MIDKDKFKEWLTEQMGTKDQKRLNNEEESDFRSRVIPISRVVDIATRCLWQIVANAHQALVQRGGIPPGASELMRSKLQGMNAMSRRLQALADEHWKDGAGQDMKGAYAGSIVEGKGKHGYSPIYMADLGFYGYGHPRWMLCPTSKKGKASIGFLMTSISIDSLTDKNGNLYEFSEVLTTKEQPSQYQWQSSIVIWPPVSLGLEDEDYQGKDFVGSRLFGQVRMRRKDQPLSHGFVTNTPITSIMSGNAANAKAVTQIQVEELENELLASEMNDISAAMTDGVFHGSITNLDVYESGLQTVQGNIVFHDIPTKASDHMIETFEARVLPGLNVRGPLRSTVIPGQASSVPRISGAFATAIVPLVLPNKCDPDYAGTVGIEMKQWITGKITEIDGMLLTEANAATNPSLKTELDQRRRGKRSCMGKIAARAEGHEFQRPAKDFFKDYAIETKDAAPRRSVKKYSLRNTK
jgi:hypothetical protein